MLLTCLVRTHLHTGMAERVSFDPQVHSGGSGSGQHRIGGCFRRLQTAECDADGEATGNHGDGATDLLSVGFLVVGAIVGRYRDSGLESCL